MSDCSGHSDYYGLKLRPYQEEGIKQLRAMLEEATGMPEEELFKAYCVADVDTVFDRFQHMTPEQFNREFFGSWDEVVKREELERYVKDDAELAAMIEGNAPCLGVDLGGADRSVMVICGDSCAIIGPALFECLKGEGCIVIDEPPQVKSYAESEKLIALLGGYEQQIKIEDIPKPVEWPCKEDFDWKRQRDYPTLKQGLRNPHFRKKHRR